ncbi:hypothetical protein GGI07_000305 [Coemansia sp. Benny D115]|nr:hypothetical protein GGI07_000305 [Coemansia sp. Benny D115]
MTASIRRSARLLSKTASAEPASSSSIDAVATAYSSKVVKTKATSTTVKARLVAKHKIQAAPQSVVIPQDSTSPSSSAAAVTGSVQSIGNQEALDEGIRFLKAADPKLGKFIETVQEPCTLMLSRDKNGQSSYESLCQSIIFQQLAGKAATAILLRFLKRYGQLKDASKTADLESESSTLTTADFVFPPPAMVAGLDVDEMRAVGLGQRKAEYLKEVATRFKDGKLSEGLLKDMSDEEVSRVLVAIRGIGQWTADMFLMFHLKRPNVLPTLDLAVRKAMCHHFGVPFGKKTPTHEQMVELARPWEPYRSIASWYMWRLMGTITQKS